MDNKFPDKVYVAIDATGMRHFFTSLDECPIYFKESWTIAEYELKGVGTLSHKIVLEINTQEK